MKKELKYKIKKSKTVCGTLRDCLDIFFQSTTGGWIYCKTIYSTDKKEAQNYIKNKCR